MDEPRAPDRPPIPRPTEVTILDIPVLFMRTSSRMRIITRRTLLDFGTTHADALAPLDDWYRVAKQADWKSLVDGRKTYPNADYVDSYTVFNIQGNAYRLIVKIESVLHLVFIKSVHTHADYDRGKWK